MYNYRRIPGTLVATYSYDGWGNCTVNNLTIDNIGNLNPIRYRSYYYDTETGYYYLNSRYYDSNTCRFINSDEINNLGFNNDVASLNIYAYCANNPIHRYDDEGDVWWVVVLLSAGSQILINVLENEPWYKNVIGATVGGLIGGFFGGIGGIMFFNAATFSLNYIENNITDSVDYTEKEYAKQFVLSIAVDVGIEYVAKPLTTANTNSSKNKNTNTGVNRKAIIQDKKDEIFKDVFSSYVRLAYDTSVSPDVPKGYASPNVFNKPMYSFLR